MSIEDGVDYNFVICVYLYCVICVYACSKP
jgi:hypothetical protein